METRREAPRPAGKRPRGPEPQDQGGGQKRAIIVAGSTPHREKARIREDDWATVGQVARALDISYTAVRMAIELDTIPHERLGRCKRLVPREWLDEAVKVSRPGARIPHGVEWSGEMGDPEEDWLDIPMAARELGVTNDCVQRHAIRGNIPTASLDGKRLIEREWVGAAADSVRWRFAGQTGMPSPAS